MAESPSLAGPLARIDRANELLGPLDTALTTFLKSRPYTSIPQSDPNPLNRRFLIRDIKDVPLRIRVLIGEVAHHLRSSLDLLVYQLLLREGMTDPKRLRTCAFPIVVDSDLSVQVEKQKHDETVWRNINGVSAKAYARIEALQPCMPANKREMSHLAQIQELDNTQKHRLVLAAAASTKLKNFAFHDDGKVQIVPEAFVPLQEGAVAVLSGVPLGMDVQVDLANVVTFRESGPVYGKPVVHILQNLSNMTRATVDSFADCL